MIDLSHRSYQKELMDGEDIPFKDMAITLEELNVVNSRLGGHTITCKGVNSLLKDNAESVTVCEIGCGGGDNLKAIQKKFNSASTKINFIGIDINPECIQYAREKYPELNCRWICSDYARVNFDTVKPDIIFSSLFCHHFTDEQLIFMLRWQNENSNLGFFINDLHRHWLAYYLIKYITKFFSKSYLVKHDAAVSVARGFKKQEWRAYFKAAGLKNYAISWQWAFRYLVTSKK